MILINKFKHFYDRSFKSAFYKLKTSKINIDI